MKQTKKKKKNCFSKSHQPEIFVTVAPFTLGVAEYSTALLRHFWIFVLSLKCGKLTDHMNMILRFFCSVISDKYVFYEMM